ncbi:MAG: SH3 domain-containing protein [Treponema sp.]|nr:SH3 domain-containing protein [Treponema sp.]
MKFFKAILIIVILVNGSNLFSQSNQLPAVMYVTASSGLIQRARPSASSERRGAYVFGQRVVVDEQGPRETISGITNHWYKTRDNTWVFGGFLSEAFPSGAPVILGVWDVAGDESLAFFYTPDGNFGVGLKESSMLYSGRWRLDGAALILNITMMGYDDVNETQRYTYTVINSNTIELRQFNGDRVRLTRNNEPWL